MKEVLCEVRCLKSTEDMILALAGQFKQLSHNTSFIVLIQWIATHPLERSNLPGVKGTLTGDTACKLKLTQIKSYKMQVFKERGKPLGAEKRTNKLNPHMTPSLGIEPGPHWWDACALTTTPPPVSDSTIQLLEHWDLLLTPCFSRLQKMEHNKRTRNLVLNNKSSTQPMVTNWFTAI